GGGGGTGVGSGGTGAGDSGGPTIVPPYASGSISYSGYNGFACSTFDNGQTGVGSCPASGGGGGGTESGSESWSEAATFNMLCGEQPHTYTAEVVGEGSGGGAGTGSGGTGAEPTSTPAPGTPTPTPTQSLYPQGCSIGATPTPDPDRGSGGTGAGGASSGALSCSCSVTLGCQTSRQAPPSDPSQQSGTCNAGVCDFTVSPEMPVFNNEVSFTVDHASSLDQNTLDFDDLSDPVSLGTGTSATHTFVNAGVYDVTLTCSNGSSSIECTRRVNTYCDNGVAPTPTPSPAPTGLSWFKIKDGAFDRKSLLVNTIPASASSFDSDDDGMCVLSGPQLYSCMLSGSAGTLRTEGSLTLGEGTSSAPAWQKADTDITTRFTPTNYLAYVRARKQITTITSLSQISEKKIYVYDGNLSLASADIASTEDFVLVVDGDLTITDSLNSLQNVSAAIVTTGTLYINEQVSTLYGIFTANTVDFSSDATSTTTPLKIVGNLVATSSTDSYNERLRTDTSKPSLFVRVDYHRYAELLDLLSTRYYEQQEIVE
ncbi:MAG: PKD domain protein, partial [Microgenomates bacterium OLB22]